MSDDQDTGDTAQVEQQARELGWQPKEEFKGAEDKWVDAKTYVDRGEHILPIVKATNKRLRDELTQTAGKVGTLEAALKQSQETIKALEEYHAEDVKQKVESARADLRAQLIAAKKDGNIEDEVRITDELTQLNTSVTDSTANKRKANGEDTSTGTRRQGLTPDEQIVFAQWQKDNPWYEDPRKAAIANYVSMKLRGEGIKDTGRPFLDRVTEETNKELASLGVGTSRPGAKVEASRGGAGGGGGGGKSYNDLPAEAKAACAGFENKLVGDGKRYKTVAEWRKSYADQYFREV